MRKLNITLSSLFFFFTFALNAQTNTFFITQKGTGNGSSWSQASNDINQILLTAQAGDQIWVAKGTYLPTTTSDKNIAFNITNGVKMYGGFKGNETSLEQRNLDKNTTILSGDLNPNSVEKNNSYNVVTFKNVSKETTLDGFTITGGKAEGVGTTGDRARCGGAIFNDGSGTGNSSNPTIIHCIFTNNSSRDGGAVYNNGIAGQANSTFIQCQFNSNRAKLDGGAVFNDGRKGGQSNPSFIDCHIEENVANYGGAICNYASKGESSPSFEKCTFFNNTAKVRGGGIFNVHVGGICEPKINDCTFSEKDASTGASLENLQTVQPNLEPLRLAGE